MTNTKSEAEAEEKPAELDIDQDMLFQRKQWVVQRIAWLIFALIVLAGLSGLLGTGPLANARAGDADVQIEYESILHRASPTELMIHPGDQITADGNIEVALTQAFLKNLEIHRIIPEPDSEELSGDEIIYSFKVGEGGPSTITFQFEPLDAGSFQGHIRINNGDPISINQLVYP
jgi:hypothetical protein